MFHFLRMHTIEELGIPNEAIRLEWVVSSALRDFKVVEKVMRSCSAQGKKKGRVWLFGDFWFVTFMIYFCATRILLFMETLGDEWHLLLIQHNLTQGRGSLVFC